MKARINNMLFFLPQLIVCFWGLQLFVLKFGAEVYNEWFVTLDKMDSVPCFIALGHLLANAEFKLIKERSCYFVSFLTIALIAVLNLFCELLPYSIYINAYTVIIMATFIYYVYKTK